MTKAASVRKRFRDWGRSFSLIGAELVRRTYAVGVIALTAWLSYLAFRYLVVTLMFPTAVPLQITGIPTRMDEQLLATRRSEWTGLQANENPRTPPAHYHRIDGWIQPDLFNNCTQSGCHAPLPHARRKEVRAFLNLHTTSLHCGVCHMQSADSPLALTWYDVRTGKARGAPAAFAAYALTQRPASEPLEPALQADLAGLLRTAAEEADGVPALRQLAEHVAAVRVTSEEFQTLLDVTRKVLPQHLRGEYGAKLALCDARSDRPVLTHPGTAPAVREYLDLVRRGAVLAPAERDTLLARIHPLRRPQALHCTDCHRAPGSLVDFTRLGYPDARRDALFRPLIFQMIEHIAGGQPMHLPQFIAPDSAPTSQPTAP